MSLTIRFLPDERSWRSEEAVDLAFAAASCGILLEQPCGSRASCGKCRVRLVDGGAPATATDVSVLGAGAAAAGWRLACRLRIDGDTTVEVPPVARGIVAKAFGDDALFAAGFEPVRSTVGGFGLAVDVGSSTLAVALVRLDTGGVAATASALNPQVRYGADVLSRIAFAQSNQDGARRLHDALVTALSDLAQQCMRAARVASGEVRDAVFVGNPTMLHALRNLDPTPLGQAPYRGLVEHSWRGAARDLDLDLPVACAYVAPGVRSHVGADTVAALLACALDRATRPTLLIDLGTNSEVALAWDGRILCTSTSAGPAFEGACIHDGMRGVPGAIEEVRIRANGSVMVRTIGGESPHGLCGSGLVDAVAELLRVGVVEASGRMRAGAELRGGAAQPLGERITEGADVGRAFTLTRAAQHPVLLTAIDVRQLQLVKASIAAGVRLLLERADLHATDLDAVLLAGAFGNYLRKESAQTIGLVPCIDLERVRFVGNAAGVGARMMLVDRAARERAEAIATTAQYVELAGVAEYESAFVQEIGFRGDNSSTLEQG